jgi:D-xylose transport system permease protein
LTTTSDPTPAAPEVRAVEETSKPSLSARLTSLIGPDVGIVPVLIALVVLIIYFEIRSTVFLSADNVSNLFIQAIIYIFLGMAEVWLLLLGEIDLSLGWTAGLSGSIAAIYTNVQFHWPWWLAFVVALMACTAIGFVWGIIVVKLNLPSFIVTLAGAFMVEGLLLYVLDHVFEGGGAPVESNVLTNLTSGNLTPLWSWIFVIAVIVFSAAVMIIRERARRAAGLVITHVYRIAIKLGALTVFGVALTVLFNVNRGSFGVSSEGTPFAVPIVFGVLAIYSFLLSRTKFGRYMYAIGGNKEAARRAGIPVNRYRVYAFMLGGFTAGIAGLFYVSRLGGYSSSSTDSSVVLYAVAAAVIGGTSLYGGRGKMTYPVVGGIILAVIINGLVLIQISSVMVFVITGAVLLGAVTVDSLARKSQTLLK